MSHSFGTAPPPTITGEHQYWTFPLHFEQACLSSLLGDICPFNLGADESAANSHHGKRDRLPCYHSLDLNTLQKFAKDRGLDADADGGKAKLCLTVENADSTATLHRFPEFAPELRTEIYNAYFACFDHVTIELGGLQPPLTRCNRQLRRESLELFYHTSNFGISVHERRSSSAPDFSPWVNQLLILQRKLHQFRNLRYLNISINARGRTQHGGVGVQHYAMDLDLDIEAEMTDGHIDLSMDLTCKTKFYKRRTTTLGEMELRNRYSDLLCLVEEFFGAGGWNVGHFMAFLEYAEEFLEEECERSRKRLTHDGRYEVHEVY